MNAPRENLPALLDDPVIAKLGAARMALAEAQTIQQSKSIADVAAAAEIYARRQQLGQEAIDFAHSVKIEALRQVGEMLKETPRAAARFDGTNKEPSKNDAPTLAELGINKKTSSMAQKLADLPPEQFEAVRDGHESIGKAIATVATRRATGSHDVNQSKASTDTRLSDTELEALRAEGQELRERLHERDSELADAEAQVEQLTKIINADDKLAEMEKRVIRFREESRVARERITGLMNEKNAAIREAKSWRKKAEARQ